MARLNLDPALWSEERLRYRVLRTVYKRAGADCLRTITGPEVGAELNLPYETLYRAVQALVEAGYLIHLGAGPRICITPLGLRYVEELAGRRESVRAG